jgi:hypothetical protein
MTTSTDIYNQDEWSKNEEEYREDEVKAIPLGSEAGGVRQSTLHMRSKR